MRALLMTAVFCLHQTSPPFYFRLQNHSHLFFSTESRTGPGGQS